MKLTPRQREQIDACRPGSDDLSSPGLAELARAVEQDRAVATELERSQRFDRNVAAALHDLPVPPGLLERLLVRLEDVSTSSMESAAAAIAPEGNAAAVNLPAPSAIETGRASRRRWLRSAGAVGLAAALAVLAAVWLWPRPLPELSREQLAMRAAHWIDQELVASDWAPVDVPPSDYPGGVLRVRPEQRQAFRTKEGWNGTAYRGAAGQVTLLVLTSPPAKIDVGPSPFTRLPASQGRSMGAWQGGGKLYVLVMERGSGLTLEQVLRLPRTA